ncbi:type II toxin-antitoxin system death-on-curing family toxin [Thalassorhabdomicrobium marinisediminis]|uniref:type II toxin-antitoxin system death-on-curing family toxin n=1 Tax=Thalassorhabdomicrobium marinisediminis TaxID=2170577 RepID=UPI002491E250|nr:type II toxin-antitoxin system death-on-curing family toxin [Thalassorhabdomicrobium marinisediminis]
MTEPTWVSVTAAIAIHDRQISRHGGAAGLRDRGLLEGAIARPLNNWQYGVTDLFDLAAAYAFDIAKAYAFVDGNKRTALVSGLTFLLANGRHVRHDTDATVTAIEDLARDAMTVAAFAEWLRSGARPL